MFGRLFGNKLREAQEWRAKGNALLAEGRLDQATDCYRKACDLAPDDALSWVNQGYGQLELGNLAQARACLQRALELDTSLADAQFLLGQLAARQHLPAEALNRYTLALAANPALMQAALERAAVLLDLERWQEALAQVDQCQGSADEAGALLLLRARALHGLGRAAEALAHIDELLAQQPHSLEALHGRANILLALGRNDDALEAALRVLQVQPEFVEGLANAGAALMGLGRAQAAVEMFRCGLALDPDHAQMHWNLGLALLSLGAMDEGWREYEWRWRATVLAAGRPGFVDTHPVWQGEALAGKTLLLHAEQGLGDTIQFVRYAPLLAERGAKILLLVPPSLAVLCAGLHPDCTVFADIGALPNFDWHCALMSVPRVVGTDLESIPASQRYLHSDAARREHWERLLGPRTGSRVGIVWSGGTLHKNDARRSMALAALLPGLPVCCQWVSLQKEVRDTDSAALGASGVLHFGSGLHGFEDTAALIDCMDVVVSVDTSVAHLAGALGKPLLLLLPHVADWRWMAGRDDSPWYPTAKLLRQAQDGQWAPVVARLRQELDKQA